MSPCPTIVPTPVDVLNALSRLYLSTPAAHVAAARRLSAGSYRLRRVAGRLLQVGAEVHDGAEDADDRTCGECGGCGEGFGRPCGGCGGSGVRAERRDDDGHGDEVVL